MLPHVLGNHLVKQVVIEISVGVKRFRKKRKREIIAKMRRNLRWGRRGKMQDGKYCEIE